MTEHEIELKSELEFYRQIRTVPPSGYSYSSIYDFLLQHGEWFTPIPFPEDVNEGAPKSCFGNALVLAALFGYSYIEGYAMPKLSKAVCVPIHHAWNVDLDGNLIDNTWMNTGLAYIGVEFSVGRADNATWFDDATILDNPFNRNILYKDKWQGENFNQVWRKSKALKKILKLRRELNGKTARRSG